MSEQFINLTIENIDKEHLCCAIADKTSSGSSSKKELVERTDCWGTRFPKTWWKGKGFYWICSIETAWVPVHGDNYLYIYCLWVAGSFKGKGMQNLWLSIVSMTQKKKENRVSVFLVPKEKPYLADKNFYSNMVLKLLIP